MAFPAEEHIPHTPGTEVKYYVASPSPEFSMAITIADVEQPNTKQGSKETLDRDIARTKLEHERKLSFIKAWEEREKSKVENKAEKRQPKVTSWENSKKASLEAQLKQIQEQLERKKAEYAEKMKNKEALVHKKAEEKRAIVEAKKGELLLQTEQMAEKYRSTGQVPKSGFRFFKLKK